MKNMKLTMNNTQLLLNHKQNHVYIKIAICLLVIWFTYHFYSSASIQFSSVIVADGDHKLPPPLPPANPTLFDQFPVNNTGIPQGSLECDIFTGEWVRDQAGPRYTNNSCNTIEHHQNCMTNGRPDSDYIYWRWSPFGCELPAFDAKLFLHYMRNKSMAVIRFPGIMCSHCFAFSHRLVEEAIEVYHDEEYRSKRWFFGSYNFTLSVIWSPFLLKADIFEDNDGHSSGAIELHLDELDSVWVNEFTNFNYIMISGGKWFLKTAVYYENNTLIGCHSCNKENVTEIAFNYAYRKAIRAVLDFITKSVMNTSGPNNQSSEPKKRAQFKDSQKPKLEGFCGELHIRRELGTGDHF
ncbi:putative PMR5 domain, PC-Esterase [Helianthus annuus]|nr:putative PMR5 domain, PC-Esterase [Helianthus annuus]KAJ0444443.1 putative PMR5 domain, PC-Esterase [Helianthus annuus]KAJ0461724.1 putative PMR5 domain, PC-Esterase [Helianthus annuus]KAJ0642127.1 putative PMR5 domain, PC-Esterase [Helianthus annuus]KAJ0646008.1 putative PMR5 domain, PC-Esterase [Helianthus annuus]